MTMVIINTNLKKEKKKKKEEEEKKRSKIGPGTKNATATLQWGASSCSFLSVANRQGCVT